MPEQDKTVAIVEGIFVGLGAFAVTMLLWWLFGLMGTLSNWPGIRNDSIAYISLWAVPMTYAVLSALIGYSVARRSGIGLVLSVVVLFGVVVGHYHALQRMG